MTENIVLPENHTQVCVWQGVLMKEEDQEDFEKRIKDKFDTRVKYLETIVTKADKTGPGGRSDIFFSVHEDDIEKFCILKVKMKARWIEDVLSIVNGGKSLYPSRVQKYISWNADDDTPEEAEMNTHKIDRICNHE